MVQVVPLILHSTHPVKDELQRVHPPFLIKNSDPEHFVQVEGDEHSAQFEREVQGLHWKVAVKKCVGLTHFVQTD